RVRGSLVESIRRPVSCTPKPRRRVLRELHSLVAELRAVPVRLLEVKADNLVQRIRPRVEPAREPLVQFGARRLRNRAIGDVPHEDVLKAERVLTRHRRPLGANKPALDEIEQGYRDRFAFLRKLLDSGARELASDDRGPLEHGPRRLVEAVETARKQRLY